MTVFRRDFLKLASTGLAGATRRVFHSALKRKLQPCRGQAPMQYSM